MIEKEIKFIDLFCGIGGFRLGLERANEKSDFEQRRNNNRDRCSLLQRTWNKGEQDESIGFSPRFKCIWSNDFNKYAAEIYKKHFGECDTRDITAVNADEIPMHDLLVAGFPCQSFSVAGKRKGFNDTRGTLFFEIARIIEAKKPGTVLLENVKGLLSIEKGRTFRRILSVMWKLGYWVEWQVLNSKNFGVPQNRERVFLIGHLGKECKQAVFPIREDAPIYPEKDTSQGSYLKSPLRGQGDRAIIQKEENGLMGISSSGRSWGRESRVTKGQANTIETGKYGDGQSSQTRVYQNQDIRRLTPIECERLQSFPDNWTEGLSDTQRYKCLGNAVTVNVIEAIGRRMY